MKRLLSKFKECLSKFFKNTQKLYRQWFTNAKQVSVSDKQGIPLDEAFRMWKEEQRKKDGN